MPGLKKPGWMNDRFLEVSAILTCANCIDEEKILIMAVKITGTRYEFTVSGPISEKNEVFDTLYRNPTEIIVNLEQMTFINSVGVKGWINWISKMPVSCKIELVKCPHVIVNQINIVFGFIPKFARVQSFFAHFACECGEEKTVLFERGKEYDYPEKGQDARFDVPTNIVCRKCQKTMEPDFIPAKLSKFLTQS